MALPAEELRYTFADYLKWDEYWVVNPEDKTAQVMLLKDGYLLPVEDYGREDLAKVNILEDCTVELSRVFPQ